MKNANEIKAEAKEQIIRLLKMCDCYRFKEKHIDKWLDKWEEACSPQIEAIAEKSPYYDGKCKIVFPSEYPRGFNTEGIYKFSEWLNNYHTRNLTQVKINGYTYKEILNLKPFFKYLTSTFYKPDMYEMFNGEFKEAIKLFETSLKSESFYENQNKFNDAYYVFRNSPNIWMINNECYDINDVNKYGVDKARTLANLIVNSNAQTQFLNHWLVEEMNYYFPACKFAEGQKLSRAVNAIASAYGLNKDPDWNKEFAKYADSINPLTVTKWTVMSWHPLDYLTFCFGNSWSTCSNIDKHNVRGVKIGSSRSSITSYVDENYVFRGEHAAAALSYMFDKTSFIYYTVNHKYNGTHYEEQDKESRIVFSLSEDNTTLLQSRLYPQCNDDSTDDSNYRIPREIVQKVIADSLEIPNLWKMKKGSEFCIKYAKSTGVHYPDYADYRNKNCNISWLGNEPHVFYLGSNAICPNCGKEHSYVGSLNCEYCDPERNDDCDETEDDDWD